MPTTERPPKEPTVEPTTDVDNAVALGESTKRLDEIEDAFFSGRSLKRIPRSTATHSVLPDK